ncbi:MAG: DUF1289 domain-containing protein [Sneathiella sp.]
MHRKVIKHTNLPDLPSPCTGVCTMDMENKNCMGCFRTRLEIGGWPHLSNDEKLVIIKQLRTRRRASTA